MRKFWDFLISISPRYWLMLYPYSAEWDRILNRLMDTEEFYDVGRFTACIGKYQVWIENYPYGAFTPHSIDLEVRPSRMTIIRTNRKIAGLRPCANKILKRFDEAH
jgi:hypothetical protein